jgi:S1-C subfamily serine protease
MSQPKKPEIRQVRVRVIKPEPKPPVKVSVRVIKPEAEVRDKPKGGEANVPATLSSRSQHIRDRVAAATVRLTKNGGQGVLVPGGFILTAAHCIEWSGTGAMALGDHFCEPILTAGGRKFLVSVYAAEPLTDIAVLGPCGNQVLPDDAEALEEFAAETPAVPLLTRRPELGKSMPALVRTHTRGWATGTVTRYGVPWLPPGGTVYIQTDTPIKGGASGGPVVDSHGRLIGVVSWTGAGAKDGTYSGAIPLAYFALPRWLADQITPPKGK